MLLFINKPAVSLQRKARKHWLNLVIKHLTVFFPYLLLYFWPTADQKRSVTFIEAQPEPVTAPPETLPATGQPQGCSPAPAKKPEGTGKPVLTSSPAIIVADLHSLSPRQVRALTTQGRLAHCILVSRDNVDMHTYSI